MDSPVLAAQEWLVAHEGEMISALQDMLRIPSLEADALPNAPFGQPNRDALDLALNWSQAAGMKTTDLEGYLGYADFGQGENLVAIFGHLDVVPVGDGWKHEPFGAEIDEGYLYSRGATDDKGPTVAAFFACRALMAVHPNLKSRIRIAFGCNEESGFKCIERYAETEEAPTYGIAPDAGWPLYHAEKGIANLLVELPLIQGEMELLSLSGGQRPNIVIDQCMGSVRVSQTARKHVDGKLADSWDKNLEFRFDGDVLHFEAKGKAAHGSRPHSGDSAAIRAARFLVDIAPVSCQEAYDDLLESMHISGMGIGIHGSDDISQLTNNLGVITTESGILKLLFNVRYPVTWMGDKLKSMCEAGLPKGFKLAEFHDSKPLYFPLDHALVKTVVDVYAEETGERLTPGIMGGGTYARAVPNTVAIGTGWQGDGEAHQTDERIKVDHVLKMAKIYAHIIYRLSEL